MATFFMNSKSPGCMLLRAGERRLSSTSLKSLDMKGFKEKQPAIHQSKSQW